MDITIPPGETATIWLPGAIAIRIDSGHRVIAVDGVSTMTADAGDFAVSCAVADAPLAPEWLVHDLRGGTYGDFHQLRPAAECFDSACGGVRGEHVTAEELAAFRDDLGGIGGPA
jgi:hypothetical protein